MGWFPSDFGVKDHAIFEYNDLYYIAATYLPSEDQFAYARSGDFCSWEELSPILTERTPGDWDENRIWAPHVFEEAGTYYMFYTGVNDDFAQSILLATSSDPSDPGSWQEQGMVFQPSHPGARWSPASWSNNRDPMVVKDNGTYYLFYTGRDDDGGIIGLAASPSLPGPWTDLGATVGPISSRILESPTFFSAWGTGYLIYHSTWLGQSYGAVYRTGSSPAGPWSGPAPLFPGWAHETWTDVNGGRHISYLTGYAITIDLLRWDQGAAPPQPYIGGALQKIFLPFTESNP